jgi:DNA-binding CsgD family transcriptional regulator
VSALWGRSAELEAVSVALDPASTEPFALVLSGEDGVGKTTVWRAALALAEERGFRVLSARPVGSEATFAFAAIADLLHDVMDEALAGLPVPQRAALEAALLRTDVETPPDPRAVAFALFSSLASLARSERTIVAIDDAEWLDGPSARVLEFAFRRLRHLPIGLVVTSRAPADELGRTPFVPGDSAFAERTVRVPIGPLDLDAVRQLVTSRIPTRFAKWMLVEIHDVSGGNPLLALELARALERHGVDVEPGHPLPIPARLAQLVSDRLGAMPDDARWMLLLVAASGRSSPETIAAAVGDRASFEEALRAAVDAELLDRPSGELRFSTPLIGAALLAQTAPETRRHVHRLLADVVTDPEEQARHLAHATDGADEEIAALLEEAADRARRRGAPETASQLAELAVITTPPDKADASTRRTTKAGRYAFEAGHVQHAEDLLQRAVHAAGGEPRAEALLFLSRVRYHRQDAGAASQLAEQALAATEDEPSLQASIHLELAAAAELSGDHATASAHARRAVDLAEGSPDRTVAAEALSLHAYYDFVSGGGFPSETLERAKALAPDPRLLRPLRSPAFHEALMRMRTDDADGARAALAPLADRARDEGDEGSLSVLLAILGELETWAGHLQRATALTDEARRLAEWTGQRVYVVLAGYAQSLVAATRGDLGRAEALATESLELAERIGARQPGAFARGALGFLELSRGDPAAAHRWLAPLTDRWRADPSVEPGLVRFVPDDAEALVASGEHRAADAILAPFEATAAALERSWAVGAAARSRGLLLAAGRELDAAVGSLDRALRIQEKLGQPIELGRTHLAKGVVLRRAKRWAPARESLARAAEVFEAGGMAAWAGRARSELGRIGGRSPYLSQLTETEEQVARLVSTGLSNKEVAARLFVSVSTVESNLRRAYRKLGVRSRTELSYRLASADDA